ncbi:MAG: hypothetical protein IPJ13_28155 [Saprospiraceae bacterium]|nr:hypothetical protein [Saprospiraceae bacterium]
MIHTLKLLTVAFLLTLLLSGCYSRKEACLDNLAANFDVTADDPCIDGCCTYPRLTIDMTIKAGDSLFRSEDTLTNNLGQKFRIIDLRCYFSEFTLFQNKGNKVKNIEFLTSADNISTINDDIVLWKWVEAGFKSGTYKNYGTFDSLTFYLGLNPTVKSTTYSNIPSTHGLSETSRLKGKDGSITDMTIRCIRMINKADTMSLAVNLDKTIKIKTIKPLITTPGKEIKYGFTADFLALMKNTDLSKSVSDIENQIKSNISTSDFVR